jgi:hypothetical protein
MIVGSTVFSLKLMANLKAYHTAIVEFLTYLGPAYAEGFAV